MQNNLIVRAQFLEKKMEFSELFSKKKIVKIRISYIFSNSYKKIGNEIRNEKISSKLKIFELKSVKIENSVTIFTP